MKLRDFITEMGGNALAHAGCIRIEKKFIPAVVQYVSHLSGIPVKDLHLLGSTGKNPDSGDIDLGIDSGKYLPDQIHARLSTRLGPDKHTFNAGLKIHSYAVPIVQRVGSEFVEVGGNVQVDFIMTPRLQWAKFAHHSEGASGRHTSYKGAIRTILLKAVASHYEEKGIDMSVYDPRSGDLLIRVGRTFDLTNGLRRIFQFRPLRKRGDTAAGAYIKSMRSVHTIEELQHTLEEMKARFPGQFDHVRLDVRDHEIVIDDPKQALRMLFPGRAVTPEEVTTAEQVLDLIQQRFDQQEQIKIFTKAKKAMDDLGGSMRIPDMDAFIEHAQKNVK
jgi:hypothetical protein